MSPHLLTASLLFCADLPGSNLDSLLLARAETRQHGGGDRQGMWRGDRSRFERARPLHLWYFGGQRR